MSTATIRSATMTRPEDMAIDKIEARRQWNANPCGGVGDHVAGLEPGSRVYFDAIRRSRYEDTDTWMPRVIDFGCARGKRLLEIGHGVGSDLLTFAEHGAEVHGRRAVLKICDAAAIDSPRTALTSSTRMACCTTRPTRCAASRRRTASWRRAGCSS